MIRLENIILFTVFLLISSSEYPEMSLTISRDFLNHEISEKFGSNISNLVNNFTINDIPIDETVTEGVTVRVQGNITNITQNVSINWNTNILRETDKYNFTIFSKNINITLNSNIEYMIDNFKEQNGALLVEIEQIQLDTQFYFTEPNCKTGVGFNLQIKEIFVNITSFSIKITGKNLVNKVIIAVENYLRPKLPSFINKIAQSQINPLLTASLCKIKEDMFVLGNQTYLATANTTKVPEFVNSKLRIPVDIVINNLVTLATNPEYKNEELPFSEFPQDVSIAISSYFINTLLWVVEDSFVLHKVVTNESLNGTSPIPLVTTNLTILFPELKKWPNKPVILKISPSSRISALFIRSGRIRTALSLSIKIIVNNSMSIVDLDKCLKEGECIEYCDLNTTLFVSVSLGISHNLLKGLIHTISIAEIKLLNNGKEHIDVEGLKDILNSIVGSLVPSLNEDLALGLPLNIPLPLNEVNMTTYMDHIGIGLNFQL